MYGFTTISQARLTLRPVPPLVLTIGFAALLLGTIATIAEVDAQTRMSYRVGFEEPVFAQKKAMNRRFRSTLKRYGKQIKKRDLAGSEAVCSRQILREAHWLVNYTTFADRVERRLAELHASLEQPDQAFAGKQIADDGSWGACFKEWYLRLSASIDPLKELQINGARPDYRLRFLDRINTPAKLVAVLESLLISKVATGFNHRKELNLISSALGQLLLMPTLDEVLDPEFPRARLAAAFIRFMDDRWQNLDTGYFGAWYDVDGKIVKTDDLSITFHMVSYRQGNVELLRRIVATTYDLRETRYPFGWHDRGVLNNHHNYDVTRLLRYGWPHMTEYQRSRARAEIAIMLARSLRLTIDGQGAFKGDAYDSIAEAYYFGVSFLDEVGYFRPSQRYWAPKRFFPGAEDVRRRLIENLAALNSKDPMALAAMRKLTCMYANVGGPSIVIQPC